MTDRPKIPHDPLPDSSNNADLRWVRKLGERGKLSGRFVRIPKGRVNEKDKPQ